MGGDYRQALEAAGAVIHEFKEFGSYQGDWYAKVTVNGVNGWINGSYGSCSGCDAFEAEFSYREGIGCDEHQYCKKADCPDCKDADDKYQRHLAEFGKTYTDGVMTQEACERYASQNIEWSEEDREALEWVKANSWTPGEESKQEDAK